MENQDAQRRGITPDPARFFIAVDLDRPRVLAFDNRATFLIYQKYGAQWLAELYEHEGPGKPLRLRSHDAFVFFLWVGLQRDANAAGESLTLEDVAEFIVPMSINELAGALLAALSATRKPHRDKPKNG